MGSLTVEQIKALGPRVEPYQVSDGDGLFLEVRPTGLKSWRVRFQVKGRPGKVNLGRWPELGVTEARSKCEDIQTGARRGLHPSELAQAKQRGAQLRATVREFGERYLREIIERSRKDPAAMRRYLERDLFPSIGDRPMAEVTLYDLRCIIFRHRDEGHAQAALAVRNLLKRMWDYAVICDVVASNPLQALKPKFIAKCEARSRSLSSSEVGAFVSRLDASKERGLMKAALILLLLTLTRKAELLLARWEHVDLNLGEWHIPAEHTKNGKPHIVYLSKQASTVFRQLARAYPSSRPNRRDFIIHMLASKTQPTAESTLNRVLSRVAQGIEHFTVHDLRRTAATLLSEDEYQADVIEKALNHSIKGVRGVYNRAQYREQRRRMLQEWADKVEALANAHRSTTTA